MERPGAQAVTGADNKAGLRRLFGNVKEEIVREKTEEAYADDALARLLGAIETITPTPPPGIMQPKQEKLLAVLNSTQLPSAPLTPSPLAVPPSPNIPMQPHHASLLAVLSPQPVALSSRSPVLVAQPVYSTLPSSSPEPPSPGRNHERSRKQRALLEQLTSGMYFDTQISAFVPSASPAGAHRRLINPPQVSPVDTRTPHQSYLPSQAFESRYHLPSFPDIPPSYGGSYSSRPPPTIHPAPEAVSSFCSPAMLSYGNDRTGLEPQLNEQQRGLLDALRPSQMRPRQPEQQVLPVAAIRSPTHPHSQADRLTLPVAAPGLIQSLNPVLLSPRHPMAFRPDYPTTRQPHLNGLIPTQSNLFQFPGHQPQLNEQSNYFPGSKQSFPPGPLPQQRLSPSGTQTAYQPQPRPPNEAFVGLMLNGVGEGRGV